jgi:hypothetical protein
MSYTRQRLLASLLPLSGLALCFGMAARAEPPRSLPVDQPTQVDGVRAACTGIGNREENESRWSSFPIKLESVGGYGQWLGNQDVTVQGQGTDISVHCAGPWVLFDLKPGRYSATVSPPNAAPKHVDFRVPASGQHEVIVRFKDLTRGQEQSNP